MLNSESSTPRKPPYQKVLDEQVGKGQGEPNNPPAQPARHEDHGYEHFPPFIERLKPDHFPVTEAFKAAIKKRGEER